LGDASVLADFLDFFCGLVNQIASLTCLNEKNRRSFPDRTCNPRGGQEAWKKKNSGQAGVIKQGDLGVNYVRVNTYANNIMEQKYNTAMMAANVVCSPT